MEYIFNPIYDKTPTGPCVKGTEVSYTLKVSRFADCESVFFVMTDDRNKTDVKEIKMPLRECDAEYSTYKIKLKFPNAGLFWYHFKVISPSGHVFYVCKNASFDSEPSKTAHTSFAQIVGEKEYPVNKNYTGGVIYHIFVDRFKKSGSVKPRVGLNLRPDWGGEIAKNSDDFLVLNRECFGGNLQGIIDKLPYIKSLGVKTIMLSPIFEAYSYHKYNTANLEKVDSMFGGDEVFKALVAAAKEQGINILLDGVFNHVGSDSVYFNKLGFYETMGAYQSPKSPYFSWFKFENYPDKYACWWGIDTLPQLNGHNPQVQKYIAGQGGVIEKHMKTGILGFRLDVADELSDDYLDTICARIRAKKPDAMVMGEVWEDAATKVAYDVRRAYFNGNQLNSVMNYPLRNAIVDFVLHGNAEGLASVLHMFKDHYPVSVQRSLMNHLGTHDTKRIYTVLREKNKERALSLLKIASALQFCSPGVPAVFYGDEAGVNGGDAPFCRVCFPWGKEDKNILAWYRKLGKLRGEQVLSEGDFNVALAFNGVFVMERTYKNNRVIVAANCGREDFRLNLKNPMTNFETGKTIKDSVLISPYGFVILHI